MKTTSDRADVPTATAREHRLRIFDATRRPQASTRDLVIKTSHGHIIRTGRLGQAHADVLDAIFFCAEKRGEMEDGRIKLLVDPARVRKVANIGSGSQFKHLIREIEAAVIEIKEPVELGCIGHLIDHIDTARRADGSTITRANPLGGQRMLWRVEVGKALCKLLQADSWKTYDPSGIARLSYGVSQALARHVSMHQRMPAGGSWKLDTLIRAVTGDIGSVSLRHRRRELREDSKLLAEIGVILTGDRVSVQQKPDSVQQKPDSVQQKPGACSKSLDSAGLSG